MEVIDDFQGYLVQQPDSCCNIGEWQFIVVTIATDKGTLYHDYATATPHQFTTSE
jgi:hypothetical protein